MRTRQFGYKPKNWRLETGFCVDEPDIERRIGLFIRPCFHQKSPPRFFPRFFPLCITMSSSPHTPSDRPSEPRSVTPVNAQARANAPGPIAIDNFSDVCRLEWLILTRELKLDL